MPFPPNPPVAEPARRVTRGDFFLKVIMSIEKPLRLGVLGLGEGRSVISAALSAPEWEIGML